MNRIGRMMVAVLFGACAMSPLTAQVAHTLDAKNWTGWKEDNKVMISKPENVKQEGSALRLMGYHLGGNPQYALKADVAKTFANKMVTAQVKFTGEFVSADASFLAFAQRISSAQTIFWSQPSYCVLFKGTKIEVQKQGKGVNPNLVFRYADFPTLGFKTFPVDQEVKVSFGVITAGSFPRVVVKVNDVAVCDFLDNKYGQTVRPNDNNLFIVGLFATNKEDANNPNPNSSLLITSLTAE